MWSYLFKINTNWKDIISQLQVCCRSLQNKTWKKMTVENQLLCIFYANSAIQKCLYPLFYRYYSFTYTKFHSIGQAGLELAILLLSASWVLTLQRAPPHLLEHKLDLLEQDLDQNDTCCLLALDKLPRLSESASWCKTKAIPVLWSTGINRVMKYLKHL
jgi:hypothetical protein